MMTIVNSKKPFHFDMIIIIMLTIFINIQELLAWNSTEGEWESKRHRDLSVLLLDECQGSCGRTLNGIKRRCRSGLVCARSNQKLLADYGLDLQLAYCRIPRSSGRRYLCYDPTKLISLSVRPSSKPSAQPSSNPSTKPSYKPSANPSAQPSKKPSSKPSERPSSSAQPSSNPSTEPSYKPSSQPSLTPKKCFTTKSELKSAADSYNALNTIQTYGTIADWCVGLVTDFSLIFFDGSANSFNEDISKWNTSSAIDMSFMFTYTSLFNQDISKWDVSKVTNMYGMFASANSFNQDISKWDVSKVTDISFMFYSATSFNQDISPWDVSKVTDMTYMFNVATSFNQNLCSWNAKCQSLTGVQDAFFDASSCSNQNDPVCGSGPFCYNCQ